MKQHFQQVNKFTVEVSVQSMQPSNQETYQAVTVSCMHHKTKVSMYFVALSVWQTISKKGSKQNRVSSAVFWLQRETY